MAEVTSTKESDWGPWQTTPPSMNHPFIMRLSESHPIPNISTVYPISGNGGRFRIVSRFRIIKTTGTSRDIYLEMEKWTWEGWKEGHTWEMSNRPSFRLLIQGAAAVVDKFASEGCVCTKCNDRNRWAEPNQPDGTYICFQCPNPNKRR